MLFGDLVGFTALAETRDAEDMRELLSRYFALASTIVARYGGTIEKFIGDAVMAVWGVPIAHEDDAERAVRAGLDLVAEARALSDHVGGAEIAMRVGVVTAEVAVTLGAVGEGMVAGDAVNTAARIQTVATPNEVWVDDATRALTSAAVSYVDVGAHELKGKAAPVHLFAARAVVAGVGGDQRMDGLEAPWVGRDRELRLVKELFHGAADEGRVHLVAVFGGAGVGKTRLAWEFEKYVDGISAVVRWHRGRALSYGDGVTFWPLAEMVRARIGVTDSDPMNVVAERLDDLLRDIAVDHDERAWLRARVGILLGLAASIDEVGAAPAREDLFAAWTRFFERVSGGDKCVVLVVDDMQYGEPGLLDFLDQLLQARFPLFVLTLARPELSESRPGWGTGRGATPIYLEPLLDNAMGEIVDGLVDGLPASAREALVSRAEGIPLYAVEMVRALVDQDAVVPRGGRYVLADDAAERVDLWTVDAPASLHALIAARIDALTPEERQVVHDAAVHGLVFPRDGLEAMTAVADLEAVLESLVRKEVFVLQSDRFSPERGQYRFVQSLVRSVAYETLARRDRKARHLAVAAYLESTSNVEDLAAIIARHYLDAVDIAPEAADAPQLDATALELLGVAARRAEALGTPDEAVRHYTAALERANDHRTKAALSEGMTRAALSSGRPHDAIRFADQARTTYLELGLPVEAGRVAAVEGDALVAAGNPRGAIDLMTPFYKDLLQEPDSDPAILRLAEGLARAHLLLGEAQEAQGYANHALRLAEAEEDWDRVVALLGRQGAIWLVLQMPRGGMALLRAAVALARERHLIRPRVIPLLNIAALGKNWDLREAQDAAREGVELASQLGARDLVGSAMVNLATTLWLAGGWDELEALHDEHNNELDMPLPSDRYVLTTLRTLVRDARGLPPDVQVSAPAAADDADPVAALWKELLENVVGPDARGARGSTSRAADIALELYGGNDDFPLVWPLLLDHSIAVSDLPEARRLLRLVEQVPGGVLPPHARAHQRWWGAAIAIASGVPEKADEDLAAASDAFRSLGVRFYLGRTLLDRGRLLAEQGHGAGAASLLDEAREIFTELRAEPWVARTEPATSSNG